ncbi:hypothetical protein CPB83DRAFT_834155 [Crepidotus variabilis]|uniref:NAD(P)-binding domain-containing protein n=1 Tax=Crepidotus variabilis TaxID=179855 RepID=A0A9P6ELJ6_9AGAR|nr:hypothetical protein CPB83DRAFT_834155 [Crepidotus variabilis]
MSTKTQLLITGVTGNISALTNSISGFIGGTILDKLMKHPAFSSYEITALLRSSEKAEKLRKLGIGAVVGSHNDEMLVESLAANADVVVATADADNVTAMKATLKGLKQRYTATGIVPTFIHTSGVAVLADKEIGNRASETIFDDTNLEQIEALPDTAMHRNVDLLLVNADVEGRSRVLKINSTITGYIKSYILLPAVWTKEIQNAKSVYDLTAFFGRAALTRGRSGMVGGGKNKFGNVHVDDTADLYILVLDATRKGVLIGHGREGYYFVESGEHTMYEPAKAIGEVLVAQGLAKEAEPSAFTQEEIQKYLHGISIFGSNCRSQANRARSIGWKPRYTKEDFLSSVRIDTKTQAAAWVSLVKKSNETPATLEHTGN